MKTLKEHLAKVYAAYIAGQYREGKLKAVDHQKKWFDTIIKKAAGTQFGKDYGLSSVRDYDDFKKRVPLQTYEDIRPYIERIIEGEKDVLWPGKPLYFAKTSGTTSGVKYIPISRESMPFHVKAARDMLLLYIAATGKTDFLRGKMIFLQGSPALEKKGGIPTGRLSGIAAHYVPKYLQKNRLPSWETNIIDDWEKKLDAIIRETLPAEMTLISGIPSWLQQYFEKLTERTGKPVGEIFPHFSLLVHGGVNFAPYRKKFRHLIGREIDTLETYPASEGFIAFQDDIQRNDLLLLTNHGIFYEFVPLTEIHKEKPVRLSLEDVRTETDYAIVLNTNAGLSGYVIGDTVRFTSTNPYRIVVTGRVKHYISAFGEHVIAKEVENAMNENLKQFGVQINEFTVAPQITPESGLPYHEWFVETDEADNFTPDFARRLDRAMQEQNIYYRDLIQGKILRPAVVSLVKPGAFHRYMQSVGRLGGQNKIPRLKNDREIADFFYRNKEIIRQL